MLLNPDLACLVLSFIFSSHILSSIIVWPRYVNHVTCSTTCPSKFDVHSRHKCFLANDNRFSFLYVQFHAKLFPSFVLPCRNVFEFRS